MCLQKEMYKMLRQVTCDHAFRTGRTNHSALAQHGIPTPLQQLRAAAKQLLQSTTQRMTTLQEDDIALQLPWGHLSELVAKLEHTQELSPPPVEPTELRAGPNAGEIYQCCLCDFLATDVASFRRHCTLIHGQRVPKRHFATASHFTTNGLPECTFCGQSFSTWRSFQTHIERGCQVLYSGPCAVEPYTALGAKAYMTGTALAAGELAVRSPNMLPESELGNLRRAPFGPALCQILETRDWNRLETLPEACHYMAKRCILCGLHYNRVQELNAHFRTMHGQYWEGVPQRAVYMSNTWATERPCPFCGALFKSHLCPVWVQVTVLLLFGAAAPPDESQPEANNPGLRCEVCLESFETLASLTEHLQSEHALQGMAFNVARDSVAGSPACAHCGILYDNLSSLRSHINQGRCLQFRPDATAESLPIRPDWVQACVEGQMKIVLGNAQSRMALTLHCQLCGVHYARSTDLSCHLQGSHARLWRCSQQLTLLLVRLFYASGQCVCNPSQHQNRLDHTCLPLRQLAMIFHKMDNKLFAPFQASEYALNLILSTALDRHTRLMFEQIAIQHQYERLWQDQQCLTTMRTQCLLCGCECAPSAMPQHLREVHPCNQLAMTFYMTLLTSLMMEQQLIDHQCYACLQIFNLPAASDAAPDPARKHLAQSHLLHNCPNLLQVALFLTGLLHDGRLLDDQYGLTGPAASPGNLQGAGTAAWHSAIAPKPKRAKTQQTPSRQSRQCSPADNAGGPDTSATAAERPGSATGAPGSSSRSRTQPEPSSRQLRSFFQPRPKERLAGADSGNADLAGAAQVINDTDDDAETTPDPVLVPRSLGEGDEDRRSQTRGPTPHCFSAESADRRRRELAVPGMGSQSQTIGGQLQASNQYDADDQTCTTACGDVQEPGPGALLSVLADQSGCSDLPMEAAALSPSGSGVGASEQALPQQRVDPPRDNAQTTCSESMRPGGHDPTHHGTSAEAWEGQRQTSTPSQSSDVDMRPPWAMLLHVLSHLRFHNDSNWCFANSTIFSLLWCMMSMQCEASSLGSNFAEVIQCLPCHNLQSVALKDLGWFNQLLQNWGAFHGNHRGRQQDASEFATAVLSWLCAPAINMTWERRVEEMGCIHAHDRGDAFMPITLSFPATHVHLPDTLYTLTHLMRLWMQVDGMIAALTQAPQCICLHLDPFYDAEDTILKSQCLIDMEAGCDVPVFIDHSQRREFVSYVLLSATAHLGNVKGGHYQAVLKTRPAVQQNGQPMHWLLTNDSMAAQPIWLVPDWFRRNSTVFWLARADCVQLHVYRPLPQTDIAAPDEPDLTIAADADTSTNVPERDIGMPNTTVDTDATESTEKPSTAIAPETDATTAAIMALLQATTMAERQR